MKSKPTEFNHCMNQKRPEGYAALRVWDIPATKKKGPHLRIKCGCCDQKVVIHYGVDEDGDTLEVNGVLGSIENWREILLPLLEWKPPATKAGSRAAEDSVLTVRQAGKKM